MFHGLNNGKHFVVVDVVVTFHGIAFSGPECDRMPSMSVELAEDAGDSKAGGVGVELDR